MSAKQNILVIGGGVIGLSTAYELSRRGASVTVIDKGEPGFGCSYGNAGWITPCFALPLPMPGMFLKAVGWLLDPESPLHIHPAADPLLFRWLFGFMRSMRAGKMRESVRALTEISKYSLEAYSKLSVETGSEFGFEKKGLLMAAQSPAGVRAAIQEMELVAAHGVPGRFLTGEETKAFEPALTGKIEGSVYFPEEAHAEPLQVVRAFAAGAEKLGAKLLSRTEIYDFEIGRGGHIQSVRTTRGKFVADQYVLATGSWSHPIARALRLRVPVLGGKGYAMITPVLSPNPSHPMMLIEKKIAVTPRQGAQAGTLRIAGTLELVNGDDSISPRRVNAIVRGAREFMNVPEEPQILELWRGLRPCTPDGVPIIGRASGFTNLTVVTGHQMLGLQSAPGSGRLAAELVLGEKPTFDPHPFRASRF
ncbi:MAG: FAD-dependent oxidoreductase [Oligoflexia bacterium]|nr:FAD-dependent oxidoreductase [Oligoflexia bacterium]